MYQEKNKMDDVKPMLSDKTYKLLKWCAQIVMPAFSSLYFGLAQTWSFLPEAEPVIGTCALLTTFMGVALGISTKSYNSSNDGELSVAHKEDGTKVFTLDVKDDPENLLNKAVVMFKVMK
jgi:hypothetical protein